jgi:hypothetical protein
MSTSPIGTRVPTLAPNAIIRAGIPLSDNFNATDVAVSVESLLASSGRFDVTFTGLEFRNIATTPLVVVQSNRAVIITSAAAILTEQTEAFNFDVPIGIDTGSAFPQFVEAGFNSVSSYFNSINASFGFLVAYQNETIGTGNAFIKSKGSDATTGDGFVRIVGTYYEIDL